MMKTVFKLSIFLIFVGVLTTSCSINKSQLSSATLKGAFRDKFLIGVAINADQADEKDTVSIKIVKHQFNSVTPENCMKSEAIHPQEDKFDFTQADQYVKFGEANNLFIVGHTLIWHSQTPPWFFVDKDGKDVTRDVLIARMKKHISTVVSRYKGRVKSWDVVNEAINDDGSWRQSKFYTIIGEDFVRLAFEFAREADPNALLCYNDYSMARPGKREGVIKMIKKLQEQGIKVDGVGMQGHLTMDFPTVADEEKSIIAFSKLGVKIMITELDLSVLPSPTENTGADVSMSYTYKKEMNPYPGGLPDSVATSWNNRMNDFFKLFLKHHDKIIRVTLWGVTDVQTWRNDWPIQGRSDYPLLFDRNYKAKPIVVTIMKEAKDKTYTK
jgi:endo-1,4-beta-xylanase